VSVSSTVTAVSLFGSPAPLGAYSSPRLALDYITDGGVSVGSGLSYQHSDLGVTDVTNDVEVTVWVIAPRVGYFTKASKSFALWPRGGITHRSLSFESSNDSITLTAITAEVPLILMLGGTSLGMFAMPHVDFGVAGGSDNVDQTATEFGLQFGLSAFF
jgi:hypothetical protein